ncbi:unnamed protein product [Diamesa serratosioi]
MATKSPVKIREATATRVTNQADAVQIVRDSEGVGAHEPITVPALMARTVKDFGNHKALVYKDTENIWQSITYKEYKDRVEKIAKVFIKLGLERHHTVAVLAFNSVEWFISELAAIHAGGILAGVYTTNSVDAVHHVLESSRANIVIVDDAKQMDKIHEIKHKLPNLKAVIQTLPPYAPFVKKDDGYYRWSELEEMNTDDVEEEYQKRLLDIAVNECCCLVYTSGTVGKPKGVMLSHDNLTWDAFAISNRLENLQMGKEVLISYLPLSHVAAQVVDIFVGLTNAVTIYFADKDALKGTLVKTLVEARPTRFLGVPRVYEKIQEKMISVGSASGPLKKIISGWAKSVTLEHHMDKMAGRPSNSVQYKIARNFILSKVKFALGFNRCLSYVTAAAPVNVDTKKYFMSLDMPLLEAFGMSESTGGHTLSDVFAPTFETIGKSLPGTQTKVINTDENGHGELCLRGRNVFMGYVEDEEKTKEAIEDGWLKTGDIGYIDSNGFVYITGRIKELIITAGGENIPPVHIEHLVKNEISALSNAFLVGDKRKFLTMLVTLKTEMAADTGAPLDQLSPETIKWLEGMNLKYTKLSEVLDAGPNSAVVKSIQEGIDRANKSSISNAQKVQKFAILPSDFSVPTGELGPTLKVKRNVVASMYEKVIDDFYN